MKRIAGLLVGLNLGAIAWAGNVPGAVYTSCAKNDVVAPALAQGASVRVVSSISGDQGTCYRIVAQSSGQTVTGAFFDETHPAIVAYHQAVRGPAQPAPAPAPAAPAAAATAEPPTRFADFGGMNFHDGARFDLSKLKTKLTVVHFWKNADDPAVKDDAEFLAYLRSQYGEQGLEVVGITAERRVEKIKSLVDNAEAIWPLIRDTTGLARQYGVTDASEVFLVNSRRKILLSGPRSDDFEQRVSRELHR